MSRKSADAPYEADADAFGEAAALEEAEALGGPGDEGAERGHGQLPADLERVLAGTLALMTSFYRCPHTALCRKLLHNLALLSRHPQLSEPLRMVCRNAGARWASYLEEVEQAVEELEQGDGDDDDEASPPTLH
jgi:hypothetical protein